MSSCLLENAKKPYNQGFPLLIHTKFSMLLPAKLHTRRFAVAVSFRRKLLTLRQLYHGRKSASTLLMSQLVQAVILPQHDAFVGLKRFG